MGGGGGGGGGRADKIFFSLSSPAFFKCSDLDFSIIFIKKCTCPLMVVVLHRPPRPNISLDRNNPKAFGIRMIIDNYG